MREEKDQFKDYEDLDVFLGGGAQGEVIKVRSNKDRKEYAMKVVESVKMSNKIFAEAIIQETLLLSKLDHENIIKVVDFYKVNGGPFVSVMEYRNSYDLHKIVTKPETIKRKNKKFAD